MPGPARARPTAPAYASRPWLASYPAGVPADLDYPRVPLTRLLDDAAASFPQRAALAFLGATLSYRELQEAVDRLATGLTGLGVRKGDRVALVLPNCPQNVIATYAALRLGAVVVQNNPLYTEAELRHQLADSGATVVVCLDRNYATVAAVRADTCVRAVVVTSLADYLPARTRAKLLLPLKASRRARSELTARVPKDAPVVHLRELLKSSPRAVQEPVDPETDLAVLQYTGGTTGTSKGAMLTHANLVSNAYMNRVWDVEAVAGREVTLAVLPLFHVFGFSVAMNATLLLGGTLVLLPRFDLDLVFDAIDTYRPTMFPGVPPIYKAIADSPKAPLQELRSMRLCVSGAMRLPVDVQRQFERISGATLVEGYGLTETSPSTHCNPLDGRRREGTIGLPLPGTLCRVVSPDDPSVEVAPGEPGELAVAGPQVFRGYWRQAEQDAVFTDDGYVLTGDVVVMDADGFFTVVDRKKELIIAGGFNVYPSEVEAVLMSLPGVAAAVVVGVPDRYRGETVKAYVVAEPGAALTEGELVEHCRTELSAYKVPKVVEIRDSLPRTPVGKVLRRALLEEERARAAAASEDVSGGRTRPAAPQPISPAVSQTVVDAPDVAGEAFQPALVEKAPRKRAVAARPREVEPVAPVPRRPPAADPAEIAMATSETDKSAPAKKAVTAKAAARKSSATTSPAAKKSTPKAPRATSTTRAASGSSAPRSSAPGSTAPGSEASERELPEATSPVSGTPAAKAKPASERSPRKRAAASASRAATPPVQDPASPVAPATSTDAAAASSRDARSKRTSARTTPARTTPGGETPARRVRARSAAASARSTSAGSTAAHAADQTEAASARTAVKKVAAPVASPAAEKRTASASAAPASKAVRKTPPPSKRSR